MTADSQAKLIAVLEPHLKPGETLLRSAEGDAADTTKFFWAVAAGMALFALFAVLTVAGSPPHPAILLLGLALTFGFAFREMLRSSRPCAIGQTSERIVVVTLRDARKVGGGKLAFAVPIAEISDIDLTQNRVGWTLWIEGERSGFSVAVLEREVRTVMPEMLMSVKARSHEFRPKPAAIATVTPNYMNIARLVFVPVGVLSAVALAQQGFDLRLNAFFGELIEAYDGSMQAVARLLFEPVIKGALDQLHAWFGVELKLLPHWKYVFILWWLVFGAIARARAQVDGQRVGAGYYALGGVCAFAGGVVAGVSPLNGLGALVCMSGLFFFLTGIHVYDSWIRWQGLEQFARGILLAFFISMCVAALGVQFYDSRGNAFGLQAAVTTVGLGALFLLYATVRGVRAQARADGGKVWARVSNDPTASACLDVLTVLGGAAVFILVATLMKG